MKKSAIKLTVLLLALLPIMFLNSCQEEQEMEVQEEIVSLKAGELEGEMVTYWGDETFTREDGKPKVVTMKIGSEDLQHFEDCFILKIKNGNEDGTNRVSSAIIKVDGKEIFGTNDFNLEVGLLEKEICGLMEESKIEVELRSEVGSFIDVWIEGVYKAGHIKIDSKGGALEFENIFLEVPPNSVNEETFFWIETCDVNNEGNEMIFDGEFSLMPEGLQFSNPVKLLLDFSDNYSNELNPALYEYYSNSDFLRWQDGEFDSEKKIYSTYLNHFSDWVYQKVSAMLLPKESDYFVHFNNYPTNVNSNNYNTEQYFRKDIMRSFYQWSTFLSPIDINFYESSNATNSFIEVFFRTPSQAAEFYGGNPLESDDPNIDVPAVVVYNRENGIRHVNFNQNISWSTLYEQAMLLPGYFTTGDIALHEVGHVIGFNPPHVLNENAVMHKENNSYLSVYPLVLRSKDLSKLELGYFPLLPSNTSKKCVIELVPLSEEFQVLQPGDKVLKTPKVKVINELGEGVANVSVMFQSSHSTRNDELSEQIVLTNQYGIAELNSWQLSNEEDDHTIYAIIGTYPHKIINFTVYVEKENDDIETGTFTDPRDGQPYETVQIGDQIWMAENYAYLPEVYPPTEVSYTESRYYVYGYNGNSPYVASATDNYKEYGVLYNWAAANDLTILPEGWHLPSEAEWNELIQEAGSQPAVNLKNESGLYWYFNDYPRPTNTTRFSAKGAGWLTDGGFGQLQWYGLFWTSSTIQPPNTFPDGYARVGVMRVFEPNVLTWTFPRKVGASVRLVKD